MKNFFTFILLVVIVKLGYSQTTPTPVQNFTAHPRAYGHRYSMWNEENFSGSISKDKRWQYQIDYQYRRMSDADYIVGGKTSNIFKNPYQQVIRPWLHYWIKPGVVRFSLSPLGYWITWTPPDEGSVYKTKDGNNVGKTVNPEFRICPQITTVTNIGRLQIQNRYRYEFRFIGQRVASTGSWDDFGLGYNFAPGGAGGSNHQGRLRLQFRAQLPINKPKIEKNTIYLNAWDELFISVGRHADYQKMLNQNRVVGLIGWKLPTEYPIKIEAGVTYQTVYLYNINAVPTQPNLTYSGRNAEINMAYTVYVIFDEFHSFIKKKKVENLQQLEESK